MNYLAHFYLSGNNAALIVGNFIGDSIKGKQIELLPLEIANGVRLHRFIDSYTDNHPVVEQSKSRLRSSYRKYSGVIVDMFYDHLLAANWNNFSNIPLAVFAQNIYKELEQHKQHMPEVAHKLILPHMKQNNWLYSYSSIEGIQKALDGMSKRTVFESNMQFAVNDLIIDYEQYNSEFLEFIPDLIEAVNKYK
jgi:acyl carrier protein phosphodiesterase